MLLKQGPQPPDQGPTKVGDPCLKKDWICHWITSVNSCRNNKTQNIFNLKQLTQKDLSLLRKSNISLVK